MNVIIVSQLAVVNFVQYLVLNTEFALFITACYWYMVEAFEGAPWTSCTLIHSSNVAKLPVCIVYRKQVCLFDTRMCMYECSSTHTVCILMASAAIKISNIPTADNRHPLQTLCMCACVYMRVCSDCVIMLEIALCKRWSASVVEFDVNFFLQLGPMWALGRCPPRFLAECCKRQLNQVSLVLLYFRLSAFSDLY